MYEYIPSWGAYSSSNADADSLSPNSCDCSLGAFSFSNAGSDSVSSKCWDCDKSSEIYLIVLKLI